MNVATWQPVSPPLDGASFYETLTAIPVAVMHFWAVWDHYDRLLDERLQELRPQFEPHVTFFSFDLDAEADVGWPVLRSLPMMNVPALVCFRYGQHHETMIGLGDRTRTETKLQEWAALAAETGAHRPAAE